MIELTNQQIAPRLLQRVIAKTRPIVRLLNWSPTPAVVLWTSAVIYVATVIVAGAVGRIFFGSPYLIAAVSALIILPVVFPIAFTAWAYRLDYRALRSAEPARADRVRNHATVLSEIFTAVAVLLSGLSLSSVGLEAERISLREQIQLHFEPLRERLQPVYMRACPDDSTARNANLCTEVSQVLAADFTRDVAESLTAALARHATDRESQRMLDEALNVAKRLNGETAGLRNSYSQLWQHEVSPSAKFWALLVALHMISFGVALKIGRALGDYSMPRKASYSLLSSRRLRRRSDQKRARAG